jgi:isoleucyl-tRNA synthetase
MDNTGEKISKSSPETLLDPRDFIEGSEKMDGERKYGFGVDVMRTWCVGKDSDRNGFVDRDDLT